MMFQILSALGRVMESPKLTSLALEEMVGFGGVHTSEFCCCYKNNDNGKGRVETE